jgi:hypothetical protein
MPGNTLARPWMAGLGGELRRGPRPSEDQAQIARGVWPSGWRQAENRMEAEAS